MKIQNNKEDSRPWDKDDESREPKFSNIRKRFVLEKYWKNIPHVPDSEYYCHGD